MANTYQNLMRPLKARGKNPGIFLAGLIGLIFLACVFLIILITGLGISTPVNSTDGTNVTIYRGRIGPYNLIVNRSPQVPTPGQNMQLELVFPDNPQPLNFNITITPDMTGMPMPGAIDIKATPKSKAANVYVANIPISMEGLWILKVSLVASASPTPLTVTFNDTVEKPAAPWLLIGLGFAMVTLVLVLVIYFFWNGEKETDDDEDEDDEDDETSGPQNRPESYASQGEINKQSNAQPIEQSTASLSTNRIDYKWTAEILRLRSE